MFAKSKAGFKERLNILCLCIVQLLNDNMVRQNYKPLP